MAPIMTLLGLRTARSASGVMIGERGASGGGGRRRQVTPAAAPGVMIGERGASADRAAAGHDRGVV